MKNILKTLPLLFILASASLLTSCEDDVSIAKPVIDLLELGLNDSHMAYIGGDLHIEAEIVAEGKISTIEVEIHQEEEVIPPEGMAHGISHGRAWHEKEQGKWQERAQWQWHGKKQPKRPVE